jgi:hypothetical protein
MGMVAVFTRWRSKAAIKANDRDASITPIAALHLLHDKKLLERSWDLEVCRVGFLRKCN